MNIREWKFERIKKKQPTRQAHFPHWEKIKRILLIYDADEATTIIASCRQQLQQEGKEVLSLGISKQKEVTDNGQYDWVIGRKEFDIWQCPKKNVLEQLKDQTFDLLIDLTQTPTIQARYMALFCSADFKVGRTDDAEQTDGLHDLLIQTQPQTDPTFLFEQSIHYLKTIRSND